MEDIFHDVTITDLRNNSMFSLYEINTLIYGKCFKICYKDPVVAQKSVALSLKKDKDFVVYTLGTDEDFWLVMPSRFPYEIPVANIDYNNDQGIHSLNYIIEPMLTTLIPRGDNPCRAYSKTGNYQYDNLGFIDCSKTQIWTLLEQRITCTIPGLEFFKNSSLKSCQTLEEAKVTRAHFRDLTYDFQYGPSKYGCPLPCERRKDQVTLQYYHNTSWVSEETEEVEKMGFQFFYFYNSLSMEERKESLVYDFSAFLIATGGNLGLFLGFSCLSVGIKIINWLQVYLHVHCSSDQISFKSKDRRRKSKGRHFFVR